MIVVRGLTPNASYLKLLTLAVQREWPVVESRAGVCRDLGAVTVELDCGERTMLLLGRGWNPVFALVEAAWVIAGRNDLKTLAKLIPRFESYSDDGRTLNGAYGHRLRHYFGRDQLEECIAELTQHPQSRRVVLSLYGANDLGLDSKDIPCNTQVTLRRVAGRLEMTVLNRSNDLWLGVPYNWFVFHVLQNLIASRLNIRCGVQRHVSSCLHIYETNVAAAENVVRINEAADLAQLEASLAPLDVPGLLGDVNALADLAFDKLSSEQLIEVFRRYHYSRAESAEILKTNNTADVLTTALDRWRSAHRLAPLRKTAPEASCLTGIRPRILRWAHLAEPHALVIQLQSVIEDALACMWDEFRQELGPGFIIEFSCVASQQRASVHFLLQLILGALEPELVRTDVGDQLINKIGKIALAAGLPTREIRPRRVDDEVLERLFGDVVKYGSTG